MFNAASALPRPQLLFGGPEHRPLPLTSSSQAHPLPVGECRFILLHPSIQNQPCSCQKFHHNRSIPGATCDCGHQACYHEHQQEPTVRSPTHTTLENRIRQLEAELRYERQIRQTELGALREALQPFYRNGEEVRLRLLDIEDRVESNYDEQVRLKDRVVALDDASMAIERRLEDVAESSIKRRRVSRQLQNGDLTEITPWASSDDHPTSRATSGFATSRSISPPGRLGGDHHSEEPRSSGVLNLVSLRSPRYVPPRVASPPREEPRSSGFLALDLAERLASRANAVHTRIAGQTPTKSATPAADDQAGMKPPPVVFIPTGAKSDKDAALDAARKRKRSNELLPLDVLASVSAISPMAR